MAEAASSIEHERGTLTRERVIDGALAHIDAHGIEALSMRRLAADLGVEAMSLYNHVHNKEAILDGVADRIWEMVELAPYVRGSGWKAWIMQAALDTYDVVAAHPNAIPLALERANRGVSLFRLVDRFLEVLVDAGFEGEDVHHAWRVLEAPFIGYVNWEATHPVWPSDGERAVFLLQVRQRSGLANLRYHQRFFEDFADCDSRRELTWGLAAILDGLEMRLNRS